MIRFSVCLQTIFNAMPLTERIERAASCGAAAVEFWSWKDKDLDEIARAKEAAGVDIAAFAGLSDNRPNDPAAADAAANEMLGAIEAAREIGATGLIITADSRVEGVARNEQIDSITKLLDATAPAARKAHVTLLLEPLNSRTDHPDALLSKTDDALAIVDEAGQPNVKMLFDVYHQYITEGAVLGAIEANIGRIGHFHLADVPGRGEPGTGALDFAAILKLIDSLDYEGFVGLEFIPSADHTEAVKSAIELA